MYKVIKNGETVFVGIVEASDINAYAYAVMEIQNGGSTVLFYRDTVDSEYYWLAYKEIPYAVQSSEKR